RVMLVGGKLVALVDDAIAIAARSAAALEARKRAIPAKGLLLLTSALEGAFKGALPAPTGDGSDNIADIVMAVAGDKRGIIDERRVAAQAATRDRIRSASAAAQAVAASAAMPGELEDLSGSSAPPAFDDTPLPDAAELARLRAEVEQRKSEMTRSMMGARDAANQLGDQAKAARDNGNTDEASQLDRRADAERARMHALLGELATLETELAELERVRKTIQDLPKSPPRGRSSSTSSSSIDEDYADIPAPAPQPSIDDALREMKRRAGGAGPAPKPSGAAPKPGPAKSGKGGGTVDDELAALKRKMQSAPPKKK
ncbi:MAG: hypothetical protein ABI867_45560, partial [Kofleriaceae bacterium]